MLRTMASSSNITVTTVTVETEGDAQLVVSVLDAQGRPKAAKSVTMSTSCKTDNNSGVASNPKKRLLPDGVDQFAPVLPEDTKKSDHSFTVRGSNAPQTRIRRKETPVVETDNGGGVGSNPKKRLLPYGFEHFAPVLPEATKQCNHSFTLRGSNAAQTRISCKACGLRLLAHADGTRVCDMQS